MKAIQTTKIEKIDHENTLAICTVDEIKKYRGYAAKTIAGTLAMALELAERAFEVGYDVILDDINKFPCANPCHMERNAMLKAFFTTIYRHNQKLFLRTDEISESLDALIKKVFS
jgi:hypothetical protein